MPKVSVIMPVYNRGNALLRASINSVLTQTFREFEFLILDDGSNDDSLTIIEQYAEQDARIRVLRNSENRGIPVSTNTLLDNVKSDFAALLDSDDLCLPHRLEKQYEFFQQHSRVDILGGQPQFYSLPTSDWEIKTTLCFYGPLFINASVMIRMETLNRHGLRYNVDIPFSQDYQLWVDCLPVATFANLPEALINNIEHADQAGVRNLQRQRADHLQTLQGILKTHNIDVADDTLVTLLGWQERKLERQDIHNVASYIKRVLAIKDFYGYDGVRAETVQRFFRDMCRKYYTKSFREIWIVATECARLAKATDSLHYTQWKREALVSCFKKCIRFVPFGLRLGRLMKKLLYLMMRR